MAGLTYFLEEVFNEGIFDIFKKEKDEVDISKEIAK